MGRLASLLVFAAMSALAAVSARAAAPSLAAAPGVLGDWQTPNDAVVRIAPCAAAGSTPDRTLCLMVVKVAPGAPLSANGHATDLKNPDPTLRDRSLCGLIIGSGFQVTDSTHLSGGKLYDPESGHTYQGTITAAGDALHLRGYIGIPLFGRSEKWQRARDVAACR